MESSRTVDTTINEIRQTLGEIELGVVTEGLTLSQLMREAEAGAPNVGQAHGWGDGTLNACAMHKASLALRARGLK